ncbi:unnamed protein product [Dicrocoelium dendriticum]|nr:unnamed protein product [Dicrocoelium dendriticum]
MTKENDVPHSKIDNEPVFLPTNKGDASESIPDRSSELIIAKHQKGNVHFKILVPSIAAGAIIGKGGEAITEIQNKTSAKVKMSKANDFYPGTTERVCLIIGTIDSVLKVFQYISEKISEKPESLLRTTVKDSRIPAERHKQVKILVPNSTAGIIIGKGGSFIKEVKENSGVFIQVSQKAKELNLAERCVTIAGELSQTYEAVKQLLVKIADDPQSSSCPNISYAEVPRPVASAYPTGSPYALVLGSRFGLNNCTMSAPGSDQLLPSGSQSSTGSTSGNFTAPHFSSFSSISPTGSTASPSSMLGTSSPSAFAAAMTAMNASPFSSGGSGGRTPSLIGSHSAGRALTGRGGATGHHPSHSQGYHHASQSLLGSATPQLGGSGSHVCASSSPMSSSPSARSTIGLEVVRNILRSAGYSDAATDEIANAMHILNLYGFISMSSLTGCATGASTISAMNGAHFTMTGNSLGTLSGPISGYVSAGPQSPAFPGEALTHCHGQRTFSTADISSTYHQQPQNYHSYSPRCCSSALAQPMPLSSSSCNTGTLFPNTAQFVKDGNSHDPLACVASSSECHLPGVQPPITTMDAFTSMGSTDPVTSRNSTTPPIVETISLSSSRLVPVSRSTGNTGNEISCSPAFLYQLSDNSLSSRLKPDNGSVSDNSFNSANGNRPSALWGLGFHGAAQAKSSSS